MSRPVKEIIEFPQSEEARHEAIITLQRAWQQKFPSFTIRVKVPISEICSEPDEEDLKAVWREESFDVLALAGNERRVAMFQVFRETEEQTTSLLKSIGKIVREHEAVFSEGI